MTDRPLALFDLDGTLANYDIAMVAEMRALQEPSEEPYGQRYKNAREAPHEKARREMIQRQPGFWRDLVPLAVGFTILEECQRAGFEIHVVTTGPKRAPAAWGEKLEWCQKHLPHDTAVSVTRDKSIMAGNVLVDDYGPYFEAWLIRHPDGLVVCPAHPWNAGYAPGGPRHKANVLRFDGTQPTMLRMRLDEVVRRSEKGRAR